VSDSPGAPDDAVVRSRRSRGLDQDDDRQDHGNQGGKRDQPQALGVMASHRQPF
jgi:hypothetical protein